MVYNGERHNIGPERLTETMVTLACDDGEGCDDLYLAVHEACLDEGEPLKLKVGKKGNVCFLCL